MGAQMKVEAKKYTLLNMVDAVSMAASDMQWMCTAISHIRKEVMRLNKLAESGKEVSQYHFSELVTHLDMYEYLADARSKYHTDESERLDEELEQEKRLSKNTGTAIKL